MEFLMEWIRNIFIVILSMSFLEIILPDSSMEKYLKFIFSMIILAVIISPLNHIN